MKVLRTVGAILLLVYGIPGMIDAYPWWRSFFADWQWWNFVMVGTAMALLGYETRTIWARIFSQKENLGKPKPETATLYHHLNNNLWALTKWYGGLPESGEPMKVVLFAMLFPIVFMGGYFLLFAPFFLIWTFLEWISNLIWTLRL